MSALSVVDLFSGTGAFSLGLERTGGFATKLFCEVDPFCKRVLAKHWPDVPCHDDVTTLDLPEGFADVVCGGFPCQDVSCAGKRAGITGERSGLYRELVRTLRMVRPRHGIVENVAALLSDGMGTVLGDLAESGFDTEWDCVPAKAIGAPHERDRVWIVAHADMQRCGEARKLRHRSDEMPSGGTAPRAASGNASDTPCEQVGIAGQPRGHVGLEPGASAHAADTPGAGPLPASYDRVHSGEEGARTRHVELERHPAPSTDAAGIGCGTGRSGRPPDSFARVRDEARRNSADPYGARLAFREGLGRDAWEELTPAERDGFQNGGKSIWPDEPALSGVDDGDAYWLDRVRATGNQVLPQIPELIGRAILASINQDAAA